MAHSHEQVAAAFANGKKVKHGSRMYNEIVHRQIMSPACDGSVLFTVVGAGFSYRTKICQTVVNHHTGLSELWVTPITYSMSTNRHEDMYRQAFIRQFMDNHKVDYDTAHDQIFTTPAVDDGTTRCNPNHARKVYNTILTDRLKDVDKPRLRSATRMGALESIRVSLENITRRMTHGVPENAIDTTTHRELLAMSAFVDNAIALYSHGKPESIDDVRVAVRGLLALSRD